VSVSRVERAATAVLGFEAGGLLVLAGWEIVALVGGDTGDAVSSIALIVLTLIGAAVVLAFSGAVWRGASWGRSGGIVVQLLILAVALGALGGGDEARPGVALALAVVAVPTLVLLFTAVRRAARADGAPGADGAPPAEG